MTELSTRIISSFWKCLLMLISPVQSYYPYICFVQTAKELRSDNVQDQLKLAVIFFLIFFQFYSSYFRHTSSPNSSSAASSNTINRDIESEDQYGSLENIQELSETISLWKNDHSTALGLTNDEVLQRRHACGYNETVKNPTWTQWLQFIWQQITTLQQLILTVSQVSLCLGPV